MNEPAWVRHAVWWHVYPLGFAGADTTGADRTPVPGFAQLIDWLDYAVNLGVSGVLLGPIFESASHGYDTLDYYRIDDRLGDNGDFEQFLTEAHRRGMRVMLDGVFNHTGRAFNPPFDGWFTGEVFEGHPELPVIDHGRPEVADYVVEVMEHWLAKGADGWRLDAAYAVPASFWAAVLGRVRRDFPDSYLVGEVIHGDYRGFVERAGMHAVTQYELWKAIWSSLLDGNFYELAWALERHNKWLDTFVPMTFIGNHDVTRIASRLGDDLLLDLSTVLLCTLAGTPSVYYGDEQAFRGVKEERRGGDDAIRPKFPSEPTQLSPHGWPVYRRYQELIGLRRRHPWLHRARTEVTDLANRRLVYRARGDGGHLEVTLDLDGRPPATDVIASGPGWWIRPT